MHRFRGNDDGRRVNVPIENIVVRNCTMKDGHGGVTIGSEISGGARQIFAERCQMDSPQLDRALRIKTNAVRGGVMTDKIGPIMPRGLGDGAEGGTGSGNVVRARRRAWREGNACCGRTTWITNCPKS